MSSLRFGNKEWKLSFFLFYFFYCCGCIDCLALKQAPLLNPPKCQCRQPCFSQLSTCDTSTPMPMSALFQNTLSNILQSHESMSAIWLSTSVHLLLLDKHTEAFYPLEDYRRTSEPCKWMEYNYWFSPLLLACVQPRTFCWMPGRKQSQT